MAAGRNRPAAAARSPHTSLRCNLPADLLADPRITFYVRPQRGVAFTWPFSSAQVASDPATIEGQALRGRVRRGNRCRQPGDQTAAMLCRVRPVTAVGPLPVDRPDVSMSIVPTRPPDFCVSRPGRGRSEVTTATFQRALARQEGRPWANLRQSMLLPRRQLWLFPARGFDFRPLWLNGVCPCSER